MRNRISVVGLTFLSLMAALALYIPATATPWLAAASSSGIPGTATQVRQVAGPRGTSAGQSDRGARQATRRNAATPARNVPAQTASTPAPNTAPLLKSFNSTSSGDSAKTNFGQQFAPPDPSVCTGNGFVMQVVNSAYTVFDTTGKILAGPYNINGPYDEGLIEYTTDPRCYYDKATNTWFATVAFLAGNGGGDHSHLDIAVNPSGDPTKIWTNYQIDTTYLHTPHHTGCPCFGDQPTLGMDKDNLYVTTNDFSILGPQNNGAQIYAIAKTDLVHLAATPHFVHWDNLQEGGSLAQIIQPALTQGNPQAEYFLSSLDPNLTFDQRLGVWAVTNKAVVATGGVPTLSSVVINSEAYGVPPKAVQKGSPDTLDSGDDRINQAQFVSGNIWGSLTTAVTIPGDPASRSGAAWFKVHPVLTGSPATLTSASILRQGYVSQAGNDIFYPALAVAPNGAAAMVFTISGAGRYPSAAYASMPPTGRAFSAVTVAAAGSAPYASSGATTRWGDYSWAVLDPSGQSFWFSTEYIPPKASWTPNGKRNWGTRVLNVGLPT